MTERKYLIYLDILGYEGLAEEIGRKKGIDERDVREKFIKKIQEKVNSLGNKITGQNYGERDDWILVTDSLDNAFYCIAEITDHYTGYKGYERIPLEFAIGTGEYDRWARFEGHKLIHENSTIKFLKSYIINYYHEWYKEKHEHSIKSTFVILTDSAYSDMEPLDRKICEEIEHNRDDKGETIRFFHADASRVEKRGRILKFLEEIHLPGNRRYKWIEDVYVEPREYDEIFKTLKEKRILFITGTPEYGKTFTAVRLMWEFYKQGYGVRWRMGGEEAERIEVRRRLEDIEIELEPKHVIYFEDPFGKIKYEKRGGLEREIGTIIETVRKVEDVYVIITSREEVFKEFEKERLSGTELRDFERRLNIKRPSYDYEKRERMLINWAEESNCRWLENEELKELVLDRIRKGKILPTPLSIREFAVASSNIENEEKLRKLLEEKSKETARAFAEEIKKMTDDKILFLSFSFIWIFKIEFLREMYQELVDELHLKGAWEFDRVLDWFKDDKIDINKVFGGKRILFSHPSYAEALEFILTENGYPSRINKEIFSKVLIKLPEIEEAAWGVAWAVAENFDRLPKNVRKLLFKLSEREEAAGYVVWAVAGNFDRLPKNVRKLLFKLAEKKEAALDVAMAVAENFNEVPEDVRKLLFKLSEREEAAKDVAWAVAWYFNRLPEDVRNQLLLKLSEKKEAAEYLAMVVSENFDKIPEDVRGRVIDALAKNSDRIPVVPWNRPLELSKKG